ncbi:hypothetical protein GCM10009550_76360 [Actinocorallia libanotica]|uniref:Uncharacterized protein n=1 Tax=Actinocorallia libanotica TaxID=46162 RepID=A0ABN1S0V2_9ACTN
MTETNIFGEIVSPEEASHTVSYLGGEIFALIRVWSEDETYAFGSARCGGSPESGAEAMVCLLDDFDVRAAYVEF